jgi:hypothetical protein
MKTTTSQTAKRNGKYQFWDIIPRIFQSFLSYFSSDVSLKELFAIMILFLLATTLGLVGIIQGLTCGAWPL